MLACPRQWQEAARRETMRDDLLGDHEEREEENFGEIMINQVNVVNINEHHSCLCQCFLLVFLLNLLKGYPHHRVRARFSVSHRLLPSAVGALVGPLPALGGLVVHGHADRVVEQGLPRRRHDLFHLCSLGGSHHQHPR